MVSAQEDAEGLGVWEARREEVGAQGSPVLGSGLKAGGREAWAVRAGEEATRGRYQGFGCQLVAVMQTSAQGHPGLALLLLHLGLQHRHFVETKTRAGTQGLIYCQPRSALGWGRLKPMQPWGLASGGTGVRGWSSLRPPGWRLEELVLIRVPTHPPCPAHGPPDLCCLISAWPPLLKSMGDTG